MKSPLLIGILGLVSSHAFAGPGSAGRETKSLTKVASIEKGEVVKPVAAKRDIAKLETAALEAPTETAPLADGVPAIPALPADASSALVPFPELEKSAAMCPKKAKAAKEKAPVVKLGANYVLGKRESAKPIASDVEHVVPKALSRAQVATVVQAQMGDVQFCWNAIPKAQRVDSCTLQLRLSIAEGGSVSDVEVVGPVSAPTQKCIAAAVAGWTFPVAETATDIEYGISLRSM